MHIIVNIKFVPSFDHFYYLITVTLMSLQLLPHFYLTKLLKKVNYTQYYSHLSKVTHPCQPCAHITQPRGKAREADRSLHYRVMNEPWKYARSNKEAQSREGFPEEMLLLWNHEGLSPTYPGTPRKCCKCKTPQMSNND